MQKARFKVFAVLVSLFLCGPLIMYACKAAGLNLPPNVTAEESYYLSGGYQETNIRENLSLAGFRDRQLQSQLELAVGNNIPFKAAALLSNASMQSSVIKASNLFFDFPAYKTNFSSDRIYIPEANAVSTIPPKDAEWRDAAIRFFAEGIRDTAMRFPDKNFILYCVDGLDVPAVSPAYDLVANSVSADETVAVFKDVLDDVENVHLVRNEYDTYGSYYSDYFRTDHHWNIQGAIKAYDSIAEALKREPFPEVNVVPIEDYLFFGSNSRSGLYPLEETAYDITYDFSNLQEYALDGEYLGNYDHHAFWDSPEVGRKVQFHDLYFDGHGPVIKNESGSGNMLFFADSFGGDMMPLFGQEYANVAWYTPFNHPDRIENTVAEFIEQWDADDIVFLANPGHYMNIESTLPDFFN